MKANGLARLTRDGELTYNNNGTAILKLGLAYDTGFGDKKKSCFIDGVIWAKQGEALAQYMKKGTAICIESADLDFQQWESNGQKRSKHVLNIRELKFAGGKSDGQNSRPAQRNTEPFESDITF